MTEALEMDTAFAPQWVSPPGDTILDLLEERGWTQQQLADRLGFSPKHVNQLINGKVPLSEDAAIRLQNVLGARAGFWLTREAQYRERVALQDAAQRHATMVPWLERFPIKELMDQGVLVKRRLSAKTKPDLVGELLAFFGVASSEQWERHYGQMEVAFRRSREDQADVAAISVWLRLGEREAEKFEGPRYDELRLRQALGNIRALTHQTPQEFVPELQHLLREAGVAFVLVPALPKTHVSGVARWLSPHRPLIQLSSYGKTNDKFWFSFFHEAAHILLHSQQKNAVFLDDPDHTGRSSDKEGEANAWARGWLIPPQHARAMEELPRTRAAVQAFAKQVGVHPGIVVGRMQHDRLLDISWLNDLKVRVLFAQADRT
ncbi:helix-turn-helix domain-containing protein [Verminephrobacter aporrectodeae]|uniref:helix-turn-helix domain-containing protein n=1 Tax=Verminephrobacter aporrectodeae TaxID=1110389 RepID=UPI002244909C|nr:helix-turn-helix domain-containing protein [Verminephrobacter aporrectodeae]